jgi:acetolactate synthase-1/2/3 large subunit
MAMGYGFPAAIGAKLAGGNRQVVCIVGDGGAMMNIQELETIARLGLDIKIFVLCNDGYATIQHTQKTHFGRESASSNKSGLRCLDTIGLMRVADGCGIKVFGVYDTTPEYLRAMFARQGCVFGTVEISRSQILPTPAIQAERQGRV